MKRLVVVLLLALVMCEFVVGGSYSEIETNFVIMGFGDVEDDLSFWGEYGGCLIFVLIVFAIVLIYLKRIKGTKKIGKSRRKKKRK